MKKRTAVLVSGALLCGIAGYFAWCLRPFHVSPPLYLDEVMSADGREAVEEWEQSAGYPKPLKLTWGNAFWNVCHPWNRRMMSPVWVTEQKGSGLWAADGSSVWSFSKTGGKWDSSTAMVVGGGMRGAGQNLVHWGTMATRLEAMDVGGAAIEVISLGDCVNPALIPFGQKPQWFNNSAEVFYDYKILGRTRVMDDRERQALVEAFARSIREGANTTLSPYHASYLPTTPAHVPAYGISFTKGEEKLEFLIWFELRGGLAFGEDVDSPDETDGVPRFSRFILSPYAEGAFDAFVEKHQLGKVASATKP